MDDELQDLRDQLEELTERASKFGEKSVSGAEKKAKEYSQMMKEKAKEVSQNIDDFAHKKPWALMAIGAGIGVVLGMGISLAAIMNKKKSFHC